MTELKCDKCESTRLTLLSSKIQGLERLIDIYFCKNCQHSKIVTTLKNKEPKDLESIGVPDIPDVDDSDYQDTVSDIQNPYDDNDGGWDPSIG
jgi:hypothetical protein